MQDVELILAPLRIDLKRMKKGKLSALELEVVRGRVVQAFGKAMCNSLWLTLPGTDADEFMFIMESDWSQGHCGYMLFACKGEQRRLVDIGSKMMQAHVSSYLGGTLSNQIGLCT